MIPDAEIISLLGTVLTKLEVGEFTIKVGARVNFQRFQNLTRILPSVESQEDPRRNLRSMRCSFRKDQEHLVGCRQAG